MLRDTSTSKPQRLLITVLGDHASMGSIASSSLQRVMREFDIAGETVRTTLSRLVAKGVLHRDKKGRETFYSLTPVGTALMKEGAERIHEFAAPREWDRQWTAVVFSVAESEREKRHVLRGELRALGFTPFFDGIWLAAFATPEQAAAAVGAADVTNVMVMRVEVLPIAGGVEAVVATWELEPLRLEYQSFIEKFEPFRQRLNAGQVSPAEALIVSTELTDDWRVFPRIDPELPLELLPKDWPRTAARKLFVDCLAKSKPMADIRYGDLLGEADRP